MHNPQAGCSPLNSSVWFICFQWMTLACMQPSPEYIGVEDFWEPAWLSPISVPQRFWIFREMRSLCPLDIFWLWGYSKIFIFFCLLCVFIPLRLRKACIKWVAWHSARLLYVMLGYDGIFHWECFWKCITIPFFSMLKSTLKHSFFLPSLETVFSIYRKKK